LALLFRYSLRNQLQKLEFRYSYSAKKNSSADNKKISSFKTLKLESQNQGRNEGGTKGHNDPGAESPGAPKSSNNVARTFFRKVHLIPKDFV